MIEIRGLNKTYGKGKNLFTALSDITFSIPDGASVAILGKSGSGKSTLMHTMSGLDRANSGEVIIDGIDILKMKPRAVDRFRARTIGFIFQSFFVQGAESVTENVSLPLEISNIPRGKRKARIDEALKSVELLDKRSVRARDLSGGQKQRLAIARAIVSLPNVIFADEPTGNLDSATGNLIVDLLFGYSKEHKATLIVVTHDEDLGSKCDIIIRVSDGKIQSVENSARRKRS